MIGSALNSAVHTPCRRCRMKPIRCISHSRWQRIPIFFHKLMTFQQKCDVPRSAECAARWAGPRKLTSIDRTLQQCVRQAFSPLPICSGSMFFTNECTCWTVNTHNVAADLTPCPVSVRVLQTRLRQAYSGGTVELHVLRLRPRWTLLAVWRIRLIHQVRFEQESLHRGGDGLVRAMCTCSSHVFLFLTRGSFQELLCCKIKKNRNKTAALFRFAPERMTFFVSVSPGSLRTENAKESGSTPTLPQAARKFLK